MKPDVLEWSFMYHYHRDMAKACEKMAPPEFSALTVTLMIELEALHGWEHCQEIIGWRTVWEHTNS